MLAVCAINYTSLSTFILLIHLFTLISTDVLFFLILNSCSQSSIQDSSLIFCCMLQICSFPSKIFPWCLDTAIVWIHLPPNLPHPTLFVNVLFVNNCILWIHSSPEPSDGLYQCSVCRYWHKSGVHLGMNYGFRLRHWHECRGCCCCCWTRESGRLFWIFHSLSCFSP